MGDASAAVRPAARRRTRHGARVQGALAAVGGLQAGAARDALLRRRVDHRRAVLRDGAPKRHRNQKPPAASRRARHRSRRVPRDVPGIYRYARRPARRRLRNDRARHTRQARRIPEAPDHRLDGAMGKGQDPRSAADGKTRRLVPRQHAACRSRRRSSTTISTCTTSWSAR